MSISRQLQSFETGSGTCARFTFYEFTLCEPARMSTHIKTLFSPKQLCYSFHWFAYCCVFSGYIVFSYFRSDKQRSILWQLFPPAQNPIPGIS